MTTAHSPRRSVVFTVQCPGCAANYTTSSDTPVERCSKCQLSNNYATFVDVNIVPESLNTSNSNSNSDNQPSVSSIPLSPQDFRVRNYWGTFWCLAVVSLLILWIVLAFLPVWTRTSGIMTEKCGHGYWSNTSRNCQCNNGYQHLMVAPLIHPLRCDYESKLKTTAVTLQFNPLSGLLGAGFWYIERFRMLYAQILLLVLWTWISVSACSSNSGIGEGGGVMIICGYCLIILLWIISIATLLGNSWVDGNGYPLG